LKSKVKHAGTYPTAVKKLAEKSTSADGWVGWIPTIILVGFFGLWSAGELYKATSNVVEKRDMRLDLLGQIPVTHEGRVKPLDSFARNTLRQLSKRETVYDGNEIKQPAIRWLADSIFETEGYKDYRLFRIEDPSVLTALDLPLVMPTPFRETKNRFRYTLAEVLETEGKLLQLLPDPKKVPEEQWTVDQKRLHDVAMKLQKVYGAKLTFGLPEVEGMDVLMKLQRAGSSLSSPLIPLVVYQEDESNPWTSFMDLQNRAWLGELARQYEVDTVTELAGSLVDDRIIGTMREKAIQEQVMRRFLNHPDFQELLKKKQEGEDSATLLELMKEQFSQEEIEKIVVSEGEMVDALLAQQRPQMVGMMEIQVAKVNGGSGRISSEVSDAEALLLDLRPAYQAGDAETFNQKLTDYLATVNANPPYEMHPYRIGAEMVYNGFSPFYVTTAIYLVAALVAMLAWIGWSVPLNRAAFWLLMLGLTIHVVGIAMRVVISGRPPVTNLYSSAVFVSAGFVVAMLLVERMTKLGIGNVMAGSMASCALIWAWTMSISDGDTFSVLVAVLDTQFWLTTHVICISIGYAATFVAGCLGLAYVVAGLVTKKMDKRTRRDFTNVIYGVVCFGLLTSFFGTVLGGLWADDSWGRFWGWDPKENGALMIVLWNAVVLHARWGGMVRERGIAGLAIIGNVITLWSWKGVNSMGVGLHAYAGTEDQTVKWILLLVAAHLLLATVALIPTRYWMSYASDSAGRSVAKNTP
jgi:ABC-type transport system involved in cytochrome c biogenesis permease subunit